MLNPWVAMLAVLGLFAALWGALAVWQRLAHPSPELARKALHVGMGLVTVSFPWVFRSPWPVVLLAGVSVGLMLGARSWGPMRRSLGGVLGSVDRASLGDVYFPISVGLVFLLAHYARVERVPSAHRLLFVIPILILTLADAMAALIGITYGLHRYSAGQGYKSAEGSMAFFAIAFLTTHVPLLLMTRDEQISRAGVLLISITIGFLVMLLEGIAWRGLDNLLVPVGAFVLLYIYTGKSELDLAKRLIAAFGWVIFVMSWRRRTSLNDAALLGAALMGYFVSAVGGWQWVVPPLLLFVGYNLIWPVNTLDARRGHSVDAVIATNAAGVAWLLLSVWLKRDFYPAFTLTYAAHLAIIGAMRLKHARPSLSPLRLVAETATKSWAVMAVPMLMGELALHRGVSGPMLVHLALAPLGIVVAVAIFLRLQPRPEELPADRARWVRQGLLSAVASSVLLAGL